MLFIVFCLLLSSGITHLNTAATIFFLFFSFMKRKTFEGNVFAKRKAPSKESAIVLMFFFKVRKVREELYSERGRPFWQGLTWVAVFKIVIILVYCTQMWRAHFTCCLWTPFTNHYFLLYYLQIKHWFCMTTKSTYCKWITTHEYLFYCWHWTNT